MTVKKILILAANPLGTTSLQLDEEVRAIEQALERARLRDRFEIKTKLAATPKDLRRALLDFDPNIVHFSGHGGGADGLLLVSDTLQQYLKQNNDGSWYVFNQQQIQFVSSNAIAGLLEIFAESVECVVLNACYSEEQAKAISAFINYTVGMNAPINDTAARKFSEGFYDGLGAGKSYVVAFKLGKNAIESEAAHLSPSDIPVMLRKAQIIQKRPLSNPKQKIDVETQAKTFFESAYEKEKRHEYRQALIDYTEAMRLKPNYIFAYTRRGITFGKLNDESVKNIDFKTAINLQAQTAEDFRGRGKAKYYLEDYQGALDDYNEAIRIDPKVSDTYINRGDAKRHLGNLLGGIADYNDAIVINPNNAEAYLSRGLGKRELGDSGGAIEDYNKAISLQPDLIYAYNNRANAKRDLGDYRGAIVDYDKVLRLKPNDAYAYFNRGATKLTMGDKQGAISDFNEAIQLKYDLADAYMMRGLIKKGGLLSMFFIKERVSQQEALNDFKEAANIYQKQGAMEAHRETLKHIRDLGG